MTGDMRELRPELNVIPVKRTSMEIITRGRHKRIRHKRMRRDKAIFGWAAVSGALFALDLIQWVIIYILQAGPV